MPEACVNVPAFLRLTLVDVRGFAVVQAEQIKLIVPLVRVRHGEALPTVTRVHLKDGTWIDVWQTPQEVLDVLRGIDAPEYLNQESELSHA